MTNEININKLLIEDKAIECVIVYASDYNALYIDGVLVSSELRTVWDALDIIKLKLIDKNFELKGVDIDIAFFHKIGKIFPERLNEVITDT